ncbi:hypothetical protein KIPE111705_21940 [Kibdelosporangium persicum]|uniref:Uncharacterized protein n=1 Tax=Kibdelosporangium persicum TaxID=2698649 RepID=A0ABX2FF61_9PSEU|nr:hypothetical protein [Kibdelosporangium persicum]NRN69418.1 hypothetical protein [Kibdelosporangium persicum]
MQGLSCYTANLHAYLAGEWDADAMLGQSVRLAVRVDLPDGQLAFSHHDPPLDRLPDGTRLCYAGADAVQQALPGVIGELATYGRVLVVVDASRLPWSVIRGRAPTPHWLLIDGRRSGRHGGQWHVVDRFTALMPAGEQLPHEGWLSDWELRDAMSLPPRWEPEQEQRNALAFGAPVPVPATRTLWLRRRPDDLGRCASLAGRWLCGDDQVLPFLMNYLLDHSSGITRHLDDLWAAVGHRGFAYRRRLAGGITGHERGALRAALTKWENLPRMLRIAAESAQRGRPRPVLARAAIEVLSRAEEGIR